MNYNIKGTELAITSELRGYVEKRLLQADKFLRGDTTALADVELEYSSMRDGAKYRAEFNLSASGTLYRKDAWGDTMHEAIDVAIGGLVQELRQNKKKRLHILRRSGSIAKDVLRGIRDRF